MKALTLNLQSAHVAGSASTGKLDLMVTEGVSGLWHYHVSTREQRVQGLAGCGARVMGSSMELADWGKPFGAHFPKRPTFCARCATQHAKAIATAAATRPQAFPR